MGAIFSYFFPPAPIDYNNYKLLEMYKPLPIDPIERLNRQSVKDKVQTFIR